MVKSLIYYTNNQVDKDIFLAVQKRLLETGLPIISVSLKPINFGENYVMEGKSGPYTLVKQIIKALEFSSGKYVFFCEHDVLYPKSHFDFTPLRDDIFYYNSHVWRWDYPKDHFITYDRLISLSSLCCNRELALRQFIAREDKILKMGWDKDDGRDPAWARKLGFEPGTKKQKRGGFSDDDFEMWKSIEPIIDIRHDKTYSRRKCTLQDFKHPPENWKEVKEVYGFKYFDTLKK
jgi:hypothetical protein